MERSWLLGNGEPLWFDPAMVLHELLVNGPEQDAGGSDNEDEDKIVKYSTDSDSDKCISDYD